MTECANWCLWKSEGAYLCLRFPTGVFGCLLVSECDYWCLRVLLVSVRAYWCLRLPTGV